MEQDFKGSDDIHGQSHSLEVTETSSSIPWSLPVSDHWLLHPKDSTNDDLAEDNLDDVVNDPLALCNVDSKNNSCHYDGDGDGANTKDGAMTNTTTTTTRTTATISAISSNNENKTNSANFSSCILYGIINATIVLPVVMSFGSIIYRDEFFQPFLPTLIRLTLMSGVVHQLCFTTFSSLPFAVGSVQDAGLIFLSSMASDTVQYCHSNNVTSPDRILATVTIGLSLATAILGTALVVIGKFGLARYVQQLPTCVVGGYLTFIGWFCGISGVGIMTPSTFDNNDSRVSFYLHNAIYILPGILGGIGLYAAVQIFKRNIAVLPTCIAILLTLFYSLLYITNTSIQDATEMGWIRASHEQDQSAINISDTNNSSPLWYHTWDFLQFDKVFWSAYPRLIVTELSMIFVVALSSSLDVAAIELELKSSQQQNLSYNQELSMVGISNFISGITGGYTGSYIFSQSIFNLRSGLTLPIARWVGITLVACQILVITSPIPILSMIPNFFYGSLLTMICVDLLYEWLWDVPDYVSKAEYSICVGTFFLIQILGVEYGIICGFVIYVVLQKMGIDVGQGRANHNAISFMEQQEQERQDLLFSSLDESSSSVKNENSALLNQKRKSQAGENKNNFYGVV